MPVTSVSLEEARQFCSWAGGRLPTLVEWQYAAQAGDPTRVYPWGVEDDTSLRPPPTTGREAGSPYSSDAEHAMRGANPWGLRDLIGNVWQWVDEERADEHTRFNLLKGGSHYQIGRPTGQIANWYFPTKVALPLNTHSKYFLMDDAYERAKTIGFRCAYDASDTNWTYHRIGAGLILLIVLLAICGAITTVWCSMRYRQFLIDRQITADLELEAFDGTLTPDEDGELPSPWSLNEAAQEAVKRMKSVELVVTPGETGTRRERVGLAPGTSGWQSGG